MNLLPRNRQEFGQKNYWDLFFKKRGTKAFEWYGEYHELCGILHKYIKTTDKVLQIGCGNSTLAADLHDVGYRSLTSIDVSDVVIRQMRDQNKDRPDLVFEKMDALNMSYSDAAFGVVLDKGTLDALFTDDSPDVVEKIYKMFSEVERVLKFGGRYVCVSLLQPHIIQHLAQWFVEVGWPIRIVRCADADLNKAPEDRIYPVFVVVATRFKKVGHMKPVIEIGLCSDGRLNRLEKVESLVESVRGCQQFAALRAKMAKGGDKSIEDACLHLCAEESKTVRYSVYLSERTKSSSHVFAAFIVPKGREVEWIFSTAEGRKQLCESADCQRLAVVHLGREADFSTLEEIKSELSSHILDFAPCNLPSEYKVPFFSIDGENINSRLERCRGKSQISGDYVVEDVDVGRSLKRRLIFLNSPSVIQSEAILVSKKGKNKKVKQVVDLTNLISAYQPVMIGALGFYLSQPVTVLVVGLGGGTLPSFIHHTFPLSNIHVVEVDPAILDVATTQFRFKTDSRMTVSIEDGLDYLKSTDRKFSVIMFDVDSKDSDSGMSPPSGFVDPIFLEQTCSRLEPDGMLVLNLVCRDRRMRDDLLLKLSSVWKTVCSVKLEEDVHEIVFATSSSRLSKQLVKTDLSNGFKLVNEHVKKSLKTKEELIDLDSCLKMLNI